MFLSYKPGCQVKPKRSIQKKTATTVRPAKPKVNKVLKCIEERDRAAKLRGDKHATEKSHSRGVIELYRSLFPLMEIDNNQDQTKSSVNTNPLPEVYGYDESQSMKLRDTRIPRGSQINSICERLEPKPTATAKVRDKDDLHLFIYSCDYSADKVLGFGVNLYCITETNATVLVRVNDFYPYLIIGFEKQPTDHQVESLCDALDRQLEKGRNPTQKHHFTKNNERLSSTAYVSGLNRFVVGWDRIDGEPFWEESSSSPKSFVKVFFAFPTLITAARTLLENPHGGLVTQKIFDRIESKWDRQKREAIASKQQKDGQPEENRSLEEDLNSMFLSKEERSNAVHKLRQDGVKRNEKYAQKEAAGDKGKKNEGNENKGAPRTDVTKFFPNWLPPSVPSPASGKFPIYEANVDFVISFFSEMNIEPSSWITIRAGSYTLKSTRGFPIMLRVSHAEKEYTCTKAGLSSCTDEELSKTLPGLRLSSWDIECLPVMNHFPSPEIAPIVTVAITVADMGAWGTKKQNVCFSLGYVDPDEMPNTLLFCYDLMDEAIMLDDIHAFFHHAESHIITGYNINDFDYPYMARRMEVVGCMNRFMDCTMLFGDRATTSMKIDRTNKSVSYIRGSGVIFFDMLNYIVTEHKLGDNTLLAVAAHFLGGKTKEEFTYGQIATANQTDRGRALMARYCMKDAELPCELFEKLSQRTSLPQFSRVFGVIMQDIVDRGTEHKVMGRLMQWCRNPMKDRAKHRLLVPTLPRGSKGKGTFKGATVFEPKPGWYNDVIVSTLDYASLYPSIIIDYNVCYTTILSKETIIEKGLVEGVDYEFRRLYSTVDVVTLSVRYCVEPNAPAYWKANKKQGVLPQIQLWLMSQRKSVRKEMEIIWAKIEELKSLPHRSVPENAKLESLRLHHILMDGKQLAIKIFMNSIYGFTSSQCSCLFRVELGSTITGEGRNNIMMTKAIVEQFTWTPEMDPPPPGLLEATKEKTIQMISQGASQNELQKALDECENLERRSVAQRKVRFEVIYGDTDSVMVAFHGITVRKDVCKALGTMLAAMVTKKLGRGLVLAFEKLFKNFHIGFTKKKYAGMKIVIGASEDKFEVKGMPYKKRGVTPWIRDTMDKAGKMLIMNGDLPGTELIIKKSIHDLLSGDVPMHRLILARTLGKRLSQYPTMAPHIKLAIENEDPKNPYKEGDRVEFVYVASTSAKTEPMNPEDSIEKGRLVDQKKYLEMFECMVNLLLGPCYHPENEKVAKKMVKEKLFMGPHTAFAKVASAPTTTSCMGRFLSAGIKKTSCVVCKASLQPDEIDRKCCKACESDRCRACSSPAQGRFCETCSLDTENAEHVSSLPLWLHKRRLGLPEVKEQRTKAHSDALDALVSCATKCIECVGGSKNEARADSCGAKSCPTWRQGNAAVRIYLQSEEKLKKLPDW